MWIISLSARILRVLDVSYCQISTIEAGAFTALESLEILNLDNNLISVIPHDVFHTVKGRLRSLHLDSNLLEYLHEHMFISTPNLSYLSLSDNELTIIQEKNFHPD